VERWTRAAQEAFSNVPKSASEYDLAGSVDRMYVHPADLVADRLGGLRFSPADTPQTRVAVSWKRVSVETAAKMMLFTSTARSIQHK
jgi:hypothetical protein